MASLYPMTMASASSVVTTLLLTAALTACESPVAPAGGTAGITVTGASVTDGGSWFQGLGVDVSLSITASPDLLAGDRNVWVGTNRVPFYLCLSADGVRFTSQCQAGLGLGTVQARVVGPSESFGISRTTHLIAFVIPPEDYGLPVTAFIRFGGGDTVPASALATHVLRWEINWEPQPE